MASLLELPPEIIIHIMEYVGSSYFSENVTRLGVSKECLGFAHTIWLKDLKLTQEGLVRRLLGCPYAERSLHHIKASTQTLDLTLSGFKDWDVLLPQLESNMHLRQTWTALQDDTLVQEWRRNLNRDVTNFAAMFQGGHRLGTLRFRTLRDPQQFHTPIHHYLAFSTMKTLLSIESLTVLELDLDGCQPFGSDPTDDHACPLMGNLLSRLKRLRLRMMSICHEAFIPPSTARPLQLTELIVNLSIYSWPWRDTGPTFADQCFCERGKYGAELKMVTRLATNIVRQVKALKVEMSAPKMVRVILPRYKGLWPVTLDILTRRFMKPDSRRVWDTDGEIIKETTDEIRDYRRLYYKGSQTTREFRMMEEEGNDQLGCWSQRTC